MVAAIPFVGFPGWPAGQWLWIAVAALLSTVGRLIFAWAYARGPASYLAVTEYSGFLWASALGWLVFHERVSLYTLAGAVLIVAGCLVAARGETAVRRRSTRRLAGAEHVDGEGDHADVENEGGEAVDRHDLAHLVSVIVTSDVANAIPQVKAK